jgi:hypothetical protein
MPASASKTTFKLLQAFEALFLAKLYNHRKSTLGNMVASHLYEDLYEGGYSGKFNDRVQRAECVVNVAGSTQGIRARRGDGKFGAAVPSQEPSQAADFMVRQGGVALTQIGTEVKVLAKSQLKQIDRVIVDLVDSARTIKAKSDKAITVGIAAVNYSEKYTGIEGTRSFPIDRKVEKAVREADETCRRLDDQVRPAFDEFLLFRFKATNRPPYPFVWLNSEGAKANYGAALVRIAALYEQRF